MIEKRKELEDVLKKYSEKLSDIQKDHTLWSELEDEEVLELHYHTRIKELQAKIATINWFLDIGELVTPPPPSLS